MKNSLQMQLTWTTISKSLVLSFKVQLKMYQINKEMKMKRKNDQQLLFFVYTLLFSSLYIYKVFEHFYT